MLRSGKFTYKAFVKQLATAAGLSVESDSAATYEDSSMTFDGIVAGSSANLRWVQDYVRRAYIRGKIDKAVANLEKGQLLVLGDQDNSMKLLAEKESESLIKWLTSFRSGNLLVESLAIPWRSAVSFMHT